MTRREELILMLRSFSYLILISLAIILTLESKPGEFLLYTCAIMIIIIIALELGVSQILQKYTSLPTVLLVSIFYLFVALLGYRSNNSKDFAKQNDYRLKLPLYESQQTFKIYLICITSMLLGYAFWKRKSKKEPFSGAENSNTTKINLTIKSNKNLLFATSFLFFSNLAYATLFGFSNLYYRDEYIAVDANITNNFLLSLLNIINLMGFFALGWISPKLKNNRGLIVWGTFILSTVVYFSDGSRTAGLGIILFFGGRLVDKRDFSRITSFGASIPVSILIMNMMLFFRDKQEHGLIGHINQLSDFDFSSFGNYVDTNFAASSFAITGFSGVIANKLPLKYFLIEINPLPGSLTGWYEIASILRYNYYTPYTSIGELHNYGPHILVLFFIVIGNLFSNSKVFQNTGSWSTYNLKQNVNSGSLLLFSLIAIQYNLRSSLRILYLCILLNLLISTLERVSLKKGRRK